MRLARLRGAVSAEAPCAAPHAFPHAFPFQQQRPARNPKDN